METLLLIVAFWLVLLGVYGAIFLPRGQMLTARPKPVRPSAPSAALRPIPLARSSRPTVSSRAAGGNNEVDTLRAQIEQLRTEVLALSQTPHRAERTSNRQEAAANLPRPLRRQLHEVRTTRRLVRI